MGRYGGMVEEIEDLVKKLKVNDRLAVILDRPAEQAQVEKKKPEQPAPKDRPATSH
jgi:hypothetical protein